MGTAYTEEETKYMVDEYTASPNRETVKRLASELGKNDRSVTSKLSKEGVYVKEPYRSKTGEKPITKEQMVKLIIEELGGNEFKLSGLEKSTRVALRELVELLNIDITAEDE